MSDLFFLFQLFAPLDVAGPPVVGGAFGVSLLLILALPVIAAVVVIVLVLRSRKKKAARQPAPVQYAQPQGQPASPPMPEQPAPEQTPPFAGDTPRT